MILPTRLLAGGLLVLMAACSPSEKSLQVFEDVTARSGLGGYRGLTYGAAWGDFDGDGLPDLYVTNHLNRIGAKLYRNAGNGRFEDVTAKYFSPKDLGGDKHGALWADFNNEGREDLMQMTGGQGGVGTEAKRLLLNTGLKFVDVAEKLGVDNPWNRGRMPLWYDLNNDGRLDLFEGAESRFDSRTPPLVFTQEHGRFVPSDDLKFHERSVPFCVITVFSGNRAGLLCKDAGPHNASTAFDTSTVPAREIKGLLPHTAFEDIAAADFDNDGQMDLFLTRKNPPGTVAFGYPGRNQVIADVALDHKNVNKRAGFAFSSTGPVTFDVFPAWDAALLTADHIQYGSEGAHPKGMTFTLSPGMPGVEGLPSSAPGHRSGVYIGLQSPDTWERIERWVASVLPANTWLTSRDRWVVQVTAPRDYLSAERYRYQEVQVRVTSSAPIDAVAAIGEPAKQEEAPARLFMNRNGKMVEEGDRRGVNARLVAGVNAVAGDFDNDMHTDLFVVVSNEIGKQENLLLLNRGDGTFDVVAHAGGAGGGTVGVGDTVTSVDYDRDGRLDLLITTGGSMGRSEGLPSDDGAYQLYHNIVANGNHWIGLDLEGTKSNRDGIGAVVRLTAGGVTQTQVQNGGAHFRAQNFQRLHFGLTKNTQVDKITVYWPSGVVQELHNVRAHQVVRIKEADTRPSPSSPAAAARGSGVGQG